MARKENERDQRKREKGEGQSGKEEAQGTGKEELLGVAEHREKTEKATEARRGMGRKRNEDRYALFFPLKATKHNGIKDQTSS